MEYIEGKDLFQYICSLEKSTEFKASQNILILKKQNMKCQNFYQIMLRIYLKEF